MSTDPFGQSQSVPAVSFKDAAPGTTVSLTVLEVPASVQSRVFETGQPATWPDGNPKMSVVTRVRVEATGEERALWAAQPSAMFAAIRDARQKAGVEIAVGGRLDITYTGDRPNDNPRLNPAKQYVATYTPPRGAFDASSPTAVLHSPTYVPAAPTYVPDAAAYVPPASAPASSDGPSAVQLAALRAANIDPATVFPGYVA